MELRILIGPHFTGQEHLRAQLEANADLLREAGTLIPPAEVASQALAVMLKTARKQKATDETGLRYLSQLTGDQACKRLLVIDPNIAGSLMRPTKDGELFPRAGVVMSQIVRQIEGHAEIRACVATRNPASLLPTYFATSLRFQTEPSFEAFAAESNPRDLRWSNVLHRVQGKDPPLPMLTWSHEDYPFIWREVAQAFSGVENKEDFVDCGAQDFPEMTLKGARLMREFLLSHPAKTPEAYDQIRGRFLEEFPASGGHIVEDVWPEDLVRDLTDAYEDDLYYIDRMSDVRTVRKPQYD